MAANAYRLNAKIQVVRRTLVERSRYETDEELQELPDLAAFVPSSPPGRLFAPSSLSVSRSLPVSSSAASTPWPQRPYAQVPPMPYLASGPGSMNVYTCFAFFALGVTVVTPLLIATSLFFAWFGPDRSCLPWCGYLSDHLWGIGGGLLWGTGTVWNWLAGLIFKTNNDR